MASGKTKQRSFHLPAEQADWLREQAFLTGRSQTSIVREAIAEHRERSSQPVSRDDDAKARLAFAEQFIEGRGLDMELLRNADSRIWGLEP